MYIFPYNRAAAVNYARRWAKKRNPAYYNFEGIGGDCTNFVSQCIYAGCGVMNYTPTFGWYYITANNRTPSWTGVEFFYDFFASNKGAGPFAEETDINGLEIGDVIQLGRVDGIFYHTLIVTRINRGNIYIASHSTDSYNRPLESYRYGRKRCLHILGCRRE